MCSFGTDLGELGKAAIFLQFEKKYMLHGQLHHRILWKSKGRMCSFGTDLGRVLGLERRQQIVAYSGPCEPQSTFSGGTSEIVRL